jgi:hypothetical protein
MDRIGLGDPRPPPEEEELHGAAATIRGLQIILPYPKTRTPVTYSTSWTCSFIPDKDQILWKLSFHYFDIFGNKKELINYNYQNKGSKKAK